jgi:coenzyme F420-0:L-glutamate ligase/coenzyme F420-1:gamma-L-glutamate ligase
MEITTLQDLPEFQPGDDIAGHIESRTELGPEDVVLIASTIVSKVEQRHANLTEFSPSKRAKNIGAQIESHAEKEIDPRFVQAVIDQSEELLLEVPFLLAVTRFGHITVNAGIDRSNVQNADILRLPENPSASAERIRDELSVDADVIVTDTSGRPFRYGQRGVAIGWAGLAPNRDWRGEQDRNGRELSATVQCVVDELAGAANLVTGEGDGGTPVAVVRDWSFGDHAGDENVFRDANEDLVRQALRSWSIDDE